MIRRNELHLIVVTMAVALALIGTSGMSAMTSERSVEVAVVEDDEAALGIEQTTTETGNETTVDMTLTNQFAGDTTLDTVIVQVDGGDEDVGPLSPGDSETVESIECDADVTIDASGSGIDVSLMRTTEC